MLLLIIMQENLNRSFNIPSNGVLLALTSGKNMTNKGTHINKGNPFKLKALVDKWPDFNTVVIRPQEQVRGQMWNE